MVISALEYFRTVKSYLHWKSNSTKEITHVLQMLLITWSLNWSGTMTVFSTGEVLPNFVSWLGILWTGLLRRRWTQICCRTELQQDKYKIKKRGKPPLRRVSYFRNRGSTSHKASPLHNKCLPHEKTNWPSVKIKDPSYNEADTQILIYNLISVLSLVLW